MSYITGLICSVLSLLLALSFAREPECVMFLYHHSRIPPELFQAYDWIVLDQDDPTLDRLKLHFYMKRRAKVFGYMSVGEIESFRDYYEDLKRFAIGKNPMWDTEVADLRREEYLDFLVDVVAKRIAERGFDGFFLDTLDSYRLVAKEGEAEDFLRGEIALIKRLKERYPDMLILINRGFEIVEEVRDLIDGVVVESLFAGLDGDRRYVKVKEEDRRYLLPILEKIRSDGLPVIVIDYLPPSRRRMAKDLVKRIRDLGFIPYVSDRELSRVGHSTCELIPRRIVLLYDSKLFSRVHVTGIHRLMQMPLEYLGFVPELIDVNSELPEIYPELGYAGIVSLYINRRDSELDRWLIKAKEEGLKLFFIEDVPITDSRDTLGVFGIRYEENRDRATLKAEILRAMEGSGFEAPLVVNTQTTLINIDRGEPVVVAKNSVGQRFVPFALTPWGGYAVSETLLKGDGLWVYDPFVIFRKVFKPSFPAPDTTTENGRRVLTAHIDGDSFFGDAEFNPKKTSGEVIRDEILRVFRVPHTVSIVEAEVSSEGLYPKKSKRLEEIARSIFSLPNVEVASHSFSHPFTWQPDKVKTEELPYGYNLPVKGYKLDFEREIVGSVKYISNLARDTGKRVRVFLWSGNCDPSEEQVRMPYELGIFNVNGGDTTITNREPFLQKISPMGVNYGDLFQVYAPVQNENLYTNLWGGPYWGYINVIQTFRLTEQPRRLKPISIYYHFYSGQKLASLNALKKVYRYALSQKVTPMFLSEYALRVLDFRDTAILRYEDGLRIRNSGYLRTLRLDSAKAVPDLRRSKGVIGFIRDGRHTYVHLDHSGDYFLAFTDSPPSWLNLVSASGLVERHSRSGGRIELDLRSYIPMELEIDTGACDVMVNGELLGRGVHTIKGGLYAQIRAFCSD